MDFGRQGRLLILPVWLTTALVPYLYAWAMFGSYQSTFSRIRFFSPNRAFKRKTQVAMMLVLNFHVRAVAEVRSPWLQRFGSVGTFSHSLSLSKAYFDQWRTFQPTDAIPLHGGDIVIVPAIAIPGIREILRRENEAAEVELK